MNSADLIIGILQKEDIEYLPAFPHSDLIDAAVRGGIRPIIVRQERHALHMADGYARMNAGRKLCATTVQYGPGSENAIGAVAQCHADNVPLLHLPGGYTDYHPDAAERYQIECLGGDYAELARALGGHAERVTDPAEVIPALERALVQNADGMPALIECITSEEKRFARGLPAGI